MVHSDNRVEYTIITGIHLVDIGGRAIESASLMCVEQPILFKFHFKFRVVLSRYK